MRRHRSREVARASARWGSLLRGSLCAICLAGCASPIAVDVVRNGAPGDARVTLSVYRTDATCADLAALTGVAPVYHQEVPGPAIGALADAPHLFVASARDRARCELGWRGCTAVRGGAREPVRVVLEALARPEGCGDARACVEGECVAGGDAGRPDGGLTDAAEDDAAMDGAVEVGTDAARDAGDGGVLDIEGCSDDFDGASLGPGWSVLEPVAGSARVEVRGNALLLEPATGGWFRDITGLFVRRDALLEGDFMLEAAVEVTRRSDVDGWPEPSFNTVGLMVRPDGVSSTWSLIDFGRQQSMTGALGKYTIDGTTELSPVAVSDVRTARLRLCRVGDTLGAYLLAGDASDWVMVQSLRRTELEGPVQVGVMATAWNGLEATPSTEVTPEVRGLVHSFGCRRIATLDTCAAP